MKRSQLLQQAYLLCLKNNREEAIADINYLSYDELEGLVTHLLRLGA